MSFDTRTIRDLDFISTIRRYFNRLLFLFILCVVPMLLAWLIICHLYIFITILSISVSILFSAILLPAIKDSSIFSFSLSSRIQRENLLQQIGDIRSKYEEELTLIQYKLRYREYLSESTLEFKIQDSDLPLLKSFEERKILVLQIMEIEKALKSKKLSKDSMKILSRFLKIMLERESLLDLKEFIAKSP